MRLHSTSNVGEEITVTVAERPAYLHDEGFFLAENVPLKPGANELLAVATTPSGLREERRVTITRELLWAKIEGLDRGKTNYDGFQDPAVLASDGQRLWWIDLGTKSKRLLPDGGGPAANWSVMGFGWAYILVAGPSGQLLSLNPITGLRTVMMQSNSSKASTTFGNVLSVRETMFTTGDLGVPTQWTTHFITSFANQTHTTGPDASQSKLGFVSGILGSALAEDEVHVSSFTPEKGGARIQLWSLKGDNRAPRLIKPTDLGSASNRVVGVSQRSAGDDIYMLTDLQRRAIHRTNFSDGAITLVSDDDHGTGPGFLDPRALASDTSSFFVGDGRSARVFKVDPSNGNRSIIAETRRGSGDPLWPVSVNYDADQQVVQVLDKLVLPGRLTKVTLGSGDRMEMAPSVDRLCKGTTGEAVAIQGTELLRWAGNLAPKALSGAAQGSGRALTGALDCVVDRASNQALVLFADAVVRVNLETGDRSDVSGASIGAGPAFTQVDRLTYDAEGDTVYVASDRIYAITAKSGDRSLLQADGTDLSFNTLADLSWSKARKRLLVQTTDALLSIDPGTQVQQVLADASHGKGPWAGESSGLALATGDTAVVGTYYAVVQLDLTSGERIVLSK
ncbi:MAG: hypothetical protein QM778_27545 [Myxococcales bacterium]